MDKAEKEKNPAMSLYWVHHLKTIINTCIHLNLMFFATRTNYKVQSSYSLLLQTSVYCFK